MTLVSASPDAQSFADLGVPASMVSNLKARGIDSPFPIQTSTIPDSLAGRDLCGRAPTGSGKTIAFGIPLVAGVRKARPGAPTGLVLVPTRELAAQVCDELRLLAGHKGPKVQAFYGGAGFEPQLRALRRGVEIAVACPGRLADLIQRGNLSLRDTDFVVIDEADRMADMGFLPEVRRILDQCRDKRQTLLFSATLDGEVDVLITRYQKNPVRHEHLVDEDDAANATHLFWAVDRADRLSTTASVVAATGPTVVFCRTRRGADRLAKQLDAAGVRSAAIHGDRSQSQRERALESFHRGSVRALVATDVAARGIHVDDVACVIHYDPPADHKDYVHRSGRTARAGQSGIVVTMVHHDVRADVKRLQKALGHPLEVHAVDLGLLGPIGEAMPTPRPRRTGGQPISQVDVGPSGQKRRPSGAARRKAKRTGNPPESSTRASGDKSSAAPTAGRQGRGRPQTGSRTGGSRQGGRSRQSHSR